MGVGVRMKSEIQGKMRKLTREAPVTTITGCDDIIGIKTKYTVSLDKSDTHLFIRYMITHLKWPTNLK